MELAYLNIHQANDLILEGQINPLELIQSCIKRIDIYDERVNSFVTKTHDMAIDQAKHLTHRREGQDIFGIPIGIKDIFETSGIRTMAGSVVFKENIPVEDAEVVRRIRQAGGVIIGKLNMHEIALGVTNVNPHTGACRNPWDETRMSGGSSGGSAAALAAGFCLGALGSDTGGSIRIPASLCGVVGLKPTYGRVSLRGVIPLSWSLDHAGPMARCVNDVAILLNIIAGYDPEDPYSQAMNKHDFLSELDFGIRGMRIALAEGEFFRSADTQVLSAVNEGASLLESMGAQIEWVDMSWVEEAARLNALIVITDAAAYHVQRLKKQPLEFGQDVLQRLQMGDVTSSTDYVLARHKQVILRRRMDKLFLKYDALVTPTTPVTAPEIEGPDALEQARVLTSFTSPFNLTGLPAISIPCGFSRDGLPIGMQIVSKAWGEMNVLKVAYAYEQATDWHTKRPSL